MIYHGRYTAEIEDDFVVFLIGAKVNSWRYLLKFPWLGQAMSEMITVLEQHPEKGYLGSESFYRLEDFTSLMVTYWRSFDDLERFARDKDDPHLEPWRRFNREINNDGTIGIWHETYLVQAGQHESIYGNMPVFGLAKATQHLAVSERDHTARGRLETEETETKTQIS
jgi:fumigallin biosynthesis monooxygenase-like protein